MNRRELLKASVASFIVPASYLGSVLAANKNKAKKKFIDGGPQKPVDNYEDACKVQDEAYGAKLPYLKIEATAIIGSHQANEIKMYGITTKEQAERHAAFLNTLRPATIEFMVDGWTGRNLKFGSEITVSDDRGSYSAKVIKVRVLNQSEVDEWIAQGPSAQEVSNA